MFTLCTGSGHFLVDKASDWTSSTCSLIKLSKEDKVLMPSLRKIDYNQRNTPVLLLLGFVCCINRN